MRSASVLHSNGDAFEFAVRDGRIVGVRGMATDRVNRGRLGPKDLFGWQAIGAADRLRRPLVRDGGTLREVDWGTAMQRIVDRSRALLEEPGGWGRFGFYTSGQLALEEYYTLAVIGKAGIGTPHMDGNTRLCTATVGGSAEGELRNGRPARLVHRRGPLRRDRAVGSQRGRDANGAVGADARPAPRATPAADVRGGPAAHTGRPGGGYPPRPATRNERRAAQRAAPRDSASRLVRRCSTWPPTRSASTSSPPPSPQYTPERVAEICDIPAGIDHRGRRVPRYV